MAKKVYILFMVLICAQNIFAELNNREQQFFQKIKENDISGIEEILKEDIDVNIRNKGNITPLF